MAWEQGEQWHLDKKVPITLIVALVAQLTGFVYFASRMSFEVEYHAKRIVELRHDIQEIKGSGGLLDRRLSGLEARLEVQSEVLRRIDNALAKKGL